MKLYWTLKSIPELQELDKSDRKEAWRFAYKKCFRHWQTYLGLAICGLCAGLGSSISDGSIWGSALGGGLGGFIYGQITTSVSRKYLYQWKNENMTNHVESESEQDSSHQSTTTP